MRIRILFFGIIFMALSANAQDDNKPWVFKGDMGLNISQMGFTNWAQGGENTVSGLSFIHLSSQFKKDKWTWDNYANLEYGLMQQASDITKKTDDLLEIGTVISHKATENWNFACASSIKTQFTKGYDYEKSDNFYISRFMAPAYVLAGLGMDYIYNKKKTTEFSAYISPITYRGIFVYDDTLAYYGAFGVQKQDIDADGNVIDFENTRTELGAFVKMRFKQQVVTNVDFITNLELFSDYLENPQNVDVDWKVEISMKINSFLSASIRTHLIYDDNILIAGGEKQADNTYKLGPKIQFKEALAVGIIYKFGE